MPDFDNARAFFERARPAKAGRCAKTGAMMVPEMVPDFLARPMRWPT